MVFHDEIEDIERLEEILEVFLEAGFSEFIQRTGLESKLPFLKRLLKDTSKDPSPVRLRKALERLGPSFIKFGQMLAQRPDIVPEAYVDELEMLEDHVAPIRGDEALAIVEESLGKKKDELFNRFELEPIASASIAQVHEAELKNGDRVAVKVRKPGVKEQIQTDLRIMKLLLREAEFASTYIRRMQVSEIFDKFEQWTQNEIDMRKEARNAKKLQRNLRHDSEVKIPSIYEAYVTERVLVEEFVTGTKINDIKALNEQGIDVKDTAYNGFVGIIKQILRDGFFHADPHPANVLVSPDAKVIYLDFGIMGRISEREKRALVMMMYHASEVDAEGFVDSLLKISAVSDDADIEAFTETVDRIFQEMEGLSIQDKPFSFAFLEIARQAHQHGIHVPTDLVVAGKGLLQAEGVGLTIYPDFTPLDEMKPLLRKLMFQQNRPDEVVKNFMISLMENRELIEDAPETIAQMVENANRASSNQAERSINLGVRQITQSLIAASLIVSGSVLLAITTAPVVQGLAIAEVVLGLYVAFRTVN